MSLSAATETAALEKFATRVTAMYIVHMLYYQSLVLLVDLVTAMYASADVHVHVHVQHHMYIGIMSIRILLL